MPRQIQAPVTEGPTPILVHPSSIRISAWYRADKYASHADPVGDWCKDMSETFVPAIAQLMAPLGLTAYTPTFVPQDRLGQVPHELALVAFRSPEIYQAKSGSVAGRIWVGPLHEFVFQLPPKAGDKVVDPYQVSYTDFPVLYPGTVKPNQACYLWGNRADWSGGVTEVLVIGRPSAASATTFAKAVADFLTTLKTTRPEGLEEMIFVFKPDCFLVWLHWSDAPMACPPLDSLRRQFRVVLDVQARPVTVPGSPFARYDGPGMTHLGDSVAVGFPRQDPVVDLTLGSNGAKARTSALWQITAAGGDGGMAAQAVLPDLGLRAGYRLIRPVVGRNGVIACHHPVAQQMVFYRITGGPKPHATALGGATIGVTWDAMTTFQQGGVSYVVGYQAAEQLLVFYRIDDDLALTQVEAFTGQVDGDLLGLTALEAFSARGAVHLMTYNGTTGAATFYAVTSLATKPIQPVKCWSAAWSPGWTRFSFFTLGDAVFFLKSNTVQRTSNIDHVLDDPSQGVREVGQHLPIDLTFDALITFIQGHRLCFAGYHRTGSLSVNEIHADCRGWDERGQEAVPRDAGVVLPLTTGADTLVLFYDPQESGASAGDSHAPARQAATKPAAHRSAPSHQESPMSQPHAAKAANATAKPVPEHALTPVPWPKGFAPKALPTPKNEQQPLPKCDAVVVTWTEDEAQALADLLTPGHPWKSWTRYLHNQADYVNDSLHGHGPFNTSKTSPELYHVPAVYSLCQIGKAKVLCIKAGFHMAKDGLGLPVKRLIHAIYTECGARLVITTGTGGAIDQAYKEGDVVVASKARFDCTKFLAKQPFANQSFACSPIPADCFKGTAPLLAANAPSIKSLNPNPQIHHEKGLTVVSTDGFAFEDFPDKDHLHGKGDICDMGDAMFGLVAQSMPHPPKWLSIRNASDPVVKTSTDAFYDYTHYGYHTSLNSVIASWAVIKRMLGA